MCTVSFVPAGKTVYLTSNRDEKTERSQALSPKRFVLPDGQQIIYPTDSQAGGTWIGLKNNGDAAVLLNGAFVKHHPKASYRKSRGLIFLDVVNDKNPLQGFREADLYDIEPFTLVLFVRQRLFECRWDGAEKFELEWNASEPHIWSSATLYDKATQRLRQMWFDKFLQQHPTPTQKDILHFHGTAGDGDSNVDLRMNRGNKVKTVSVTSLHLQPHCASLSYFDLERGWQATKGFDCLAITTNEEEAAYA